MLIFKIFVSLWLNECDGCVTLQDPNFVTIGVGGPAGQSPVWWAPIFLEHFAWNNPI